MRSIDKSICHAAALLVMLSASPFVLGQASGQVTFTPVPPSSLTEVDTLVKIFGGLLAGIATLIGLPIVFLTYKKTRAEITKLELEANSLRNTQKAQSTSERDDEGNIRIVLDNSPNSTIHVLADPRFLAPLLILLDFIFASIAITIVGYLLSIFDFGEVRAFALTVLSFLLLVPIARQVLRVRVILRPPRTAEEAHASNQQVRIVAYVMFGTIVASVLFFGLIVLLNAERLAPLGRYVGWGLMGVVVLIIIALPLMRRRLDLYLSRLNERDSQSVDAELPESKPNA